MDSEVRVCIVTAEYLPNWGGIGSYCVEVSRAISRSAEVHVVTLRRGKAELSEQSNIQVHYIGESNPQDTFYYNARFQYSVLRVLPSLVREYNFDVVHTNFPPMPDLLPKLLGQVTWKELVTIHTTIEGQRGGILAARMPIHMLDRSEKSTLVMYPALVQLERYYLRRSRNFITVSNWMKREMTENNPHLNHVSVVYRGIDTDRFRPRQNRIPPLAEIRGPLILFSSRLTVAKGVHLVIRAMPGVLRRHKDAHFVFAGAGPQTEWISLLRETGVDENRYTFLGYVPYELLTGLYSSADIFVSVGLYENFPARVLEAMSSGPAVIALDRGAMQEAIDNGENGILLPRGGSGILEQAILRLLEDSETRRRISEHARETILSRFSIEKFRSEMMKVYEQAAESRPS